MRRRKAGGIDHRHAQTGRDPQASVTATNAADTRLPRLRSELHPVGFVEQRVLELIRRIGGDLVDLARMETDDRGARIHADPDLTLQILDENGHQILQRCVVLRDRQ